MVAEGQGRFSIVGVGPGDPDLVTLKAARLIGAADVIAFHAGVKKSSNARRIVADLIVPGTAEEELRYPVTTGATDHAGGYAGAMVDFYADCAERLGARRSRVRSGHGRSTPAAGPRHGRAHRAAGHAARAGARSSPGRQPGGGAHEARSHVPRGTSRARGSWPHRGRVYVERASMAEERRMPVAEVDAESVPYFSLIVVPGDTLRRSVEQIGG